MYLLTNWCIFYTVQEQWYHWKTNRLLTLSWLIQQTTNNCFYFSQKTGHFIQIVSFRDDLHEIFPSCFHGNIRKYFKMSPTENFTQNPSALIVNERKNIRIKIENFTWIGPHVFSRCLGKSMLPCGISWFRIKLWPCFGFDSGDTYLCLYFNQVISV